MIDSAQRKQITDLFEEFVPAYLSTKEGLWHREQYAKTRAAGRVNYQTIVGAEDRGEDITDAVLLKLLPYDDNARTREIGAWIHYAPSINGDVRKWFESNHWVKAEDWPVVAQAILDFVKHCHADPDSLMEACQEFSDFPLAKGFQAGMLSPIVNALHPDRFALINNKSRTTINYLAGTKLSNDLLDYPALNEAAFRVVTELDDLLRSTGLDLVPADVLDMFSHWLVAVKGFSFRPVHYWKVAPGENAWQWQECLEGSFIAIGWDELGNLNGVDRTTFLERYDRLGKELGWTAKAPDQVWTFAHQIAEGDLIVANRGTREVLGIGIVTGPYYYVSGARHSHRLPVDWFDKNLRQVKQGGWRRTIARIQSKEFEIIRTAPLVGHVETLAEPFASIFANRAEAEWAFDFLERTLGLLGVTASDCDMVALTLPKNRPGVLRLNYGSWLVVDFCGPKSYSGRAILLALLVEDLELGQYKQSNSFSDSIGQHEIAWFTFPVDVVRSMSSKLEAHYERSFRALVDQFANWEKSNMLRHHQHRVFEAIFDREARAKLLSHGVSETVVDPTCPFTPRSFELLQQLHDQPTAAFYAKHKSDFDTHVEQPFQRLMQAVAERLPDSINQVMETKDGVFAKIRKNDFGRGSAWDYYWGAFYPKGGRRIQDAQLSLWINADRLEFGFYIGDYGPKQRTRFTNNVREHRAILEEWIGPLLDDSDMIYGPRENYAVGPDGTIILKTPYTRHDFLDNPAGLEFDISCVLPAAQVLSMSESEFIERIRDFYMRVFPLVLLASSDDPLPDICAYLQSIGAIDVEGDTKMNPVYPLDVLAIQTGIDEAQLDDWVQSIHRKGQAVVYGPPGTGKTYVAEWLSRHLIGGGDGFSELVQFHPSYSYEEFIQGIRPTTNIEGHLSYQMVPGRFLDFCRRADACQDTCVLIVDEINRANLSRVFGELMYLLEYRDRTIPLAGGRTLRIRNNIRIIGTMNTADRSIALVDHALRRRFAFIALFPNFDVLQRFHAHKPTAPLAAVLIGVLKELNLAIGDPNYHVGISYFLRDDLHKTLPTIWQMEIVPYLEEFFFDQLDRVDLFRWPSISTKFPLPTS